MIEVNKLVSVIIPCYNAGRWVGEAVSSCLRQTYRPLEIIVIDDGSTDDSADVLRSFGGKIRWERGPNRGGCYARNRGFSLSEGRYIQFLDADDYLLPEKIERQVAFLEKSGADVVYGDWRHQRHEPDGGLVLEKVQISGAQDDVLESLLGGWWTANMALLLRREVIPRHGGWDESLEAGQDGDFFISIAMSGAGVCYQPGCYSIYRRYGNVTVSTSSLRRWLENRWRLLNKAESKLVDAGRLSAPYRQALARSYFHLARNYHDIDRSQYARLMKKTLSLQPGFRPGGSAFYRSVQRIFGFELADRLAGQKRKIVSAFNQ
jgi:glycosyltransferase involved in cell wall biosynthesis